MSKWQFDESIALEPTTDFMADLQELFAIDPDLLAVRLYWQWGGYDDSDYYGSYGQVEVTLPGYLDPKKLAKQKPQLAALAWAFQHNHQQSFRIFDEGSDGGSSVLVVTRDGFYFGIANSMSIEDPDNEVDQLLSDDGEVAHGLHQVEIQGQTSAHDRIAGMSRFRELFPKLCELLDEISENGPTGDND